MKSLSIFDIMAVLLTLSAIFGYINHRYLRLPHTIGLVVIALAASGVVVLFDLAVPSLGVADAVRDGLKSIDFYETLMEGMLSALLFAGAVHVDFAELSQRKWAIGLMASFGVLISTFLIGTAMWGVFIFFGINVPWIWALVFGALISPTDPVAVLGILKTVHIPRLLEAKIAGESLFNDGVGVVIFVIILAIAGGTSGHGSETVDAATVATLFFQEAVGGAVLGIAAGYLAYFAMRRIDEHNLEVLITLALVFGTYALALHFHLSGPIAVVVSGLFIGNHGARFAMSENTRQHVFQFWELADEIMNSVLFLLIGLEVLVIGSAFEYAWLGVIAIVVVLASRWTAVSIPIALLSLGTTFTKGAITMLTWGGLRGGISVALALSLPENEFKAPILAATYAVVVFSIVIQGLTMKPLVDALGLRQELTAAEEETEEGHKSHG
ncbi:MAG: sodium:proton antiporter [Alphaproteobacteria bacterium]|nr:sodium:proton antiporter [Alphaproteobacteria bacterium]